MIRGRFGASRSDVVRLFDGGSVAGLGDGELLERFALSRDEVAFEALVAKLGPMVLGVCRRMLTDSHDVDDAFQATFLVLVRRAGSIRDRDLVAAWLHGVATRVARRAKASAIRRAARERVAVVDEARDEPSGLSTDWSELRALIDEEIERLPEHHRRAVILCDVEGLSREEAAIRLGWSLNMVRGRLERARDRLRGRLARRGLAPSGSPLALLAASPGLSPTLLATTCRAALSFGVGRVGAGLATASAVALSEGVLNVMMLSKIKIGLAIALSTGLVAGSGIFAAQGLGEKQDPAKPAAPQAPAAIAQDPAKADDAFQPRPAADLAKARIDSARQRLETQMAFYNEGRITIDRLINASQALMQAKLDASEVKAERVATVREHYGMVKLILAREEAELLVGRATTADVFEAKERLLDAEFLLAKEMERPGPKAAAKPAINRSPRGKLAADRVEMARRVFESSRELYRNARIELLPYLEACQSLLEAEEAAATTKAELIQAVESQIKFLKETLAIAEAKHQAARGMIVDVDRVRSKILDAEAHLIDVSEGPEPEARGVTPEAAGPLPTTRLNTERVEIARRIFNEASRLFPNEIDVLGYLEAWKLLLEAEEAAATTKAGRVAAVQGQLELLTKRALPAMEEGFKTGMKKRSDVDRLRLKILDTEAHLIDVSKGSDVASQGVAPEAAGPLPTTGPAADGPATGGAGDALVAMARKNYEAIVDETVESIVHPRNDVGPADNKLSGYLNRPKAELFYLWSRRWMEAQRDRSNGSKADEVAAIEGHRVRMEALEKGQILVACSKRNGKDIPPDALAFAIREIPEFQDTIKYYRLEADAWLAKAKSR